MVEVGIVVVLVVVEVDEPVYTPEVGSHGTALQGEHIVAPVREYVPIGQAGQPEPFGE